MTDTHDKYPADTYTEEQMMLLKASNAGRDMMRCPRCARCLTIEGSDKEASVYCICGWHTKVTK